jgi:hypothetical protein
VLQSGDKGSSASARTQIWEVVMPPRNAAKAPAAKPAAAPQCEEGPSEKATRADVAKMPPHIAGSGLAATALEMARGLDGANSLTSKSMAAKAHMEIMNRLRELAPEEEHADSLDELKQRRSKRHAKARSGAASSR